MKQSSRPDPALSPASDLARASLTGTPRTGKPLRAVRASSPAASRSASRTGAPPAPPAGPSVQAIPGVRREVSHARTLAPRCCRLPLAPAERASVLGASRRTLRRFVTTALRHRTRGIRSRPACRQPHASAAHRQLRHRAAADQQLAPAGAAPPRSRNRISTSPAPTFRSVPGSWPRSSPDTA